MTRYTPYTGGQRRNSVSLGTPTIKATPMFLRGCEGEEVYFSFILKKKKIESKKRKGEKKESPFPHWAWFLVWETPPFWSTDWSNSSWDNLCPRPPCLIGSPAQFSWESHPTWLGGVLSFHTRLYSLDCWGLRQTLGWGTQLSRGETIKATWWVLLAKPSSSLRPSCGVKLGEWGWCSCY